MASIKRNYVPIPNASDGRFWCIDTAFVPIGVGCYETTVFEAIRLSNDDYDIDWDDLDMAYTYNKDAAIDAHGQMIKKWSNITKEEALKRYDEQ